MVRWNQQDVFLGVDCLLDLRQWAACPPFPSPASVSHAARIKKGYNERARRLFCLFCMCFQMPSQNENGTSKDNRKNHFATLFVVGIRPSNENINRFLSAHVFAFHISSSVSTLVHGDKTIGHLCKYQHRRVSMCGSKNGSFARRIQKQLHASVARLFLASAKLRTVRPWRLRTSTKPPRARSISTISGSSSTRTWKCNCWSPRAVRS